MNHLDKLSVCFGWITEHNKKSPNCIRLPLLQPVWEEVGVVRGLG